MVALIRANRDVKLLMDVETGLRLAAYRPGRIEFTPTADAPADLAAHLAGKLQGWTGARWVVTVVDGCTEPTIAETRDEADRALRAEAARHPLVQAALAAFPGAEITEVKSQDALEAVAAEEALPEVDEEWDPFEED